MADAKLQIILTAVDKASKTIKGATGSMSKFSTAAKVGATAAAGFGVAVGVSAVNQAVAFEAAMSDINTLMDDNGQKVDQLSKGIKNLLKTTPKTADDLGASAYAIVSAGISDTSDALKVLEASGKLAVAGLGETAEATDLMTSAINAFELDVDGANATADVFFKAVKNGKTTVAELAQGFGQVAPLANAMGVSFDELLAITSAMTTSGLKASVAYTQIRATLSNLAKPTAEMKELMDQLNITNLQAEIQNNGLQSTTTGGNNEMLAKAFGSVEALNAVMMLMGETGELTNQIFDDMAGGQEALTAAFDKQNQTTEKQFQLLKNKWGVILIDLGTKILPILITAMEQLSNFIDSASTAFDNFTTALSKVFIAYNKVADAAQRAFEAMKRAKEFVGGKISGAIDFVTGRAGGGVVGRGETTLVGENGPEIAQFPAGTRITPNGQFGGTVINITGTFLDEDSGEKVGDMILEKLKLQQAI